MSFLIIISIWIVAGFLSCRLFRRVDATCRGCYGSGLDCQKTGPCPTCNGEGRL